MLKHIGDKATQIILKDKPLGPVKMGVKTIGARGFERANTKHCCSDFLTSRDCVDREQKGVGLVLVFMVSYPTNICFGGSNK